MEWTSSRTPTQTALFVSDTQDARAWELSRRQIPRPGRGEILVRVLSTALNHFDWMVHKKGHFVKNYPAIVGLDGSGDVVQVGEGVTNFVKGDRVCHSGSYLADDRATCQFYAIVPARFTAKIPHFMSYDEASTIPLCLSAAALGLYSPLHKHGLGLVPPWLFEGRGRYTGQSIVIIGGASSVGQFVTQLARESGFGPIIAISSTNEVEILTKLGASHVVNCSSTDLVRRVCHLIEASRPSSPHSPSRLTPSGLPTPAGLANGSSSGGLADVVYDARSTPETQLLAHRLVKPTGSIAYSLPGEPTFANMGVSKIRDAIAFAEFHPELAESLFAALPRLLKSGVIRPIRYRNQPGGITAIPHSLELLQTRRYPGYKLIVNIEDR